MLPHLDFYTQHDLMTDPGPYASHFDALPDTIAAIRDLIQGIMVHIFWAERYGLSLSEERKAEVNLRPVSQMLAKVFELDASPLTTARPPERRLVGNCRDFTAFAVAMLRHKGIPARARCGFGTYFLPDHYEDHWVCEYWNAAENRWVMVDAQIDALQRKVLRLPFDPLDMPPGMFVTGGKAWLMCREEGADPSKFGIFDMHGWAFIRGDLIRDFLGLNNIIILPWDRWGLIIFDDAGAVTEDVELIDRMARLTLAGDSAFDAIRAMFENEPRLHIPEGWQP